MKRITASLAALALLVSFRSQAFASSGTEGASFLDIPVGAEPAALGSAYTALANDAYAPVWNPAGLGTINGNELAGQHTSYLDSINYEFLSFVHPLDVSRGSDVHRGVGVSVQYLGSGQIAKTDIDPNTGGPLNLGSYSSYFASYNLSYGQTLTDKVSIGATGKLIHASIDDVSASAYAMDLGGMYKMNEKLNFGASLVNLGSQLKFISEGDSLPMAFKVGGAYKPDSHYLITSEVVLPKTGLAAFHMGGEWRPLEAVSLRMGYKTDTLKGLSPMAGFTAGFGLHVWGQELAYAWAPYGDLGDAQYLSLLIKFGAQEEEKRNLIQYQTIKQHRTVKNGHKDDVEPEYMQLMQLLSEDDTHTAEVSHGSSDVGDVR